MSFKRDLLAVEIRSPQGVLALHVQNIVLHLEGKLVSASRQSLIPNVGCDLIYMRQTSMVPGIPEVGPAGPAVSGRRRRVAT